MRGKGFLIILIMVFLTVTYGCGYLARYDGAYKGKIIDADTGEPIEGVVVLGVWYRETPTPAGAVSSYYDARETVTDKNGEFTIQGQGLLIASNIAPMSVLIFKAGYEYIDVPWVSFKIDEMLKQKIRWNGNKAIIPLRKLTMEERKKDPLYPPIPPTKAPLSKVQLMLREINKDLLINGFDPMTIWNSEKI